MKLSVVIPVYNEEKTIGKLLDLVLTKETPKEVIVVDDCPTDKTKEKIKLFKNKEIKILFHEANNKYYQNLLCLVKSGQAKVVYGTRLKTLPLKFFSEDKTSFPLHYVANRFLSALTNLLHGSKLTDMKTGYKMMTREVYKKLDLVSNRFEIEPKDAFFSGGSDGLIKIPFY